MEQNMRNTHCRAQPPQEWLDTAASIAARLNLRAPSVTMCPAWLMGPNPGAVLLNGRVLVNQKALELPEDVRRYVIAHELGHLKHKHGKAAFLAFCAVMLLYAVNPPLCGLIELLYLTAFLMPYGLGDRAEFQADAVAADVMGSPYAVIRAQREVMRVMEAGVIPQRERRWKRLRALAQARTERERHAIASEQGCRLQGPEAGGDGAAGE